MSIWIILFIALVVAYFVITEGAKKYFDIKVQVLFTAGMYQQCIDLLDRKLARIVMSTFKQYYLRFTIYEADNNVMAAERMLEHLLVHMLTVGKWILGPSRRRTTPYGTSAKETATPCGAISSKN